jgi:hypothetical protein
MNRKLLSCTIAMAITLSASFSLAQQTTPSPSNGLAIGKNPKLLQSTRDSNAGAGDGSDIVKSCKIDFSSGAHKMKMACTVQEIDPGNSHDRNQSPECDYVNCTFDPRDN